jgi:hypothetical protein
MVLRCEMKRSNLYFILLWIALANLVAGDVQADVLWDNGTFINHPGGMTGDAIGADRSYVTPDGNALGFSMTATFSLADNFSLSTNSTITSLTFFGYTPGVATPGATALYVRIWDERPWAGGSVVWGDLTTNRLSHNDWMAGPSTLGVYRTRGNQTNDNTRRIQEVTANNLNIDLAAGGYWLEWNVTDVWLTPPLNSDFNPNALKWGDAQQYNSTTAVWTPLFSGVGIPTPIDVGFVVSGTAVPEPSTFSVLGVLTILCLLNRRR